MSSHKEFFVIDAHGFLHRNYHALPKLSTSKGEEVGALYGFVNWLLKFIKEKQPKYAVVCFDSKGPTFRHDMYKEYKANRPPTDDALITQLKTAREVVAALGFKTLARAGAEADDLMASAAISAAAQGAEAMLITSDKDIYQIIGDKIKMWSGGSKDAVKDGNTCQERFGVPCKYMADYLAIVGDSSDNIPGIAGLGPKAAQELINAFGPVEEIIKAAERNDDKMKPAIAKKVLEGKEDALISKKLAVLDTSLTPGFELADYTLSAPDAGAIQSLVERFEFRNLASFMHQEQEFAVPAAAPQSPPVQGDLFAPQEEIFDASAQTALFDKLVAQAASAKEIFLYAEEDGLVFAPSPQDSVVVKTAALKPAQLQALFDIISNPHILKIGHDLKYTLRQLNYRAKQHTFINCFDTALAKYCLDPSGDFSLSAALPVDPAEPRQKRLAFYAQHIWQLKTKLEAQLKEQKQQEVFSGMEIPLLTVLLDMETNGIMVDTAWLKTLGHLFAKEMETEQKEINKIAGGEININSPKQLGVLLFETLKLPPYKKTKTGYSTDEEALAHLQQIHPVANHILKYRESAKLKSTYSDALLSLASAQSHRVHTNFNQTGTVTGRLSSFSPNLQNIPIRTEKGRLIRQAFTAPQGSVLLSADYSQIDLRVLAHESGDSNLINAFHEHGDIHTQTAAEVFGIMPELITKEQRNRAKTINFGIVYGQGPLALSQALNISTREAKEFIDAYFARYRVVKQWLDDAAVAARKAGYVKTLFGHIRYLPEFEAGNARLASFANRASVNTIVQGSASDIIKKAMLDIYAHQPADVLMLLQVHDELVFEVPQAKIKETAAWVKHKMESAVKLKVPLVAEAKAGKNWNEMGKV